MNDGRTYRRRRFADRLVKALCVLATALALLPLVLVVSFVLFRGLAGLSLAFFTELPTPVGVPGGGMANAIVGSLQLVGMACLFGVPTGVAAGVYLAEQGHTRLGRTARFAADVMAGVPSITVGIFIYSVVVLTTGTFSALAGALALATLMLPTVTRTTEELVRLVPAALREAALGLGVAPWRATVFVVLRTALPGIVTGVMLAIARIAGETAPLLFTSPGSLHWSAGIDEPVASLPVQIYNYALSPYESWHEQAWAAALVLLVIVLALDILARWLFGRRQESR